MGEVFISIPGVPKKFPPNWDGELPRPFERHELAERFAAHISKQGWSSLQSLIFLDYRTEFHQIYYVSPEGRTYHRLCGGGSVVEVVVEGAPYCDVYCANCGLLPSFPPPPFVSFNGNGR